MFPLGGYSESMANDEAHEPIWCDRCGCHHGGEVCDD